MSKSAAAPGSGGTSLVWIQGLACGGLVALVPATALLLGVLLLPGLVALALDHRPGRPLARSILLCGATACIAPVRDLWAVGQTVDASLSIVGDINSIGTAWSAAAAGWLMAELLPVVVRVALEASSLARAVQLRSARAKLVEEWGEDIGTQ
jgi:hypothetical protein